MLLSWNAERLTIATPTTTEPSCSANTDHTSLLLWCSAFTSNKYIDAHPLRHVEHARSLQCAGSSCCRHPLPPGCAAR